METLQQDVSGHLSSVTREVTDAFAACDLAVQEAEKAYREKVDAAENERKATVEKAEARRAALREQFRDALAKMQSIFGTPLPSRKKAVRENKPIKALVMEFLEGHRTATTKEIRAYLQSCGRKTNPGVELSRMVKDGSIINAQRGVYALK